MKILVFALVAMLVLAHRIPLKTVELSKKALLAK
jgi:Eukaryotic aspartyl protease